MWRTTLFFLFLGNCVLIFSACTIRSKAYYDYYAHLRRSPASRQVMQESDYFLVILVDACHLDYFQGLDFLKSVAKHPSNGSRTGSVGHAWIYLQGPSFALEGGHSGEGNSEQVCYFDGVMDNCEKGLCNPVSYLWKTLHDGFFQKGSGGHLPTCAVKVFLTPAQFQAILEFIHPQSYDYQHYALVGAQCSSFVAEVAALAGLQLERAISIQIPSKIHFRGATIRLWEHPFYSSITLTSPDVLEKSLLRAVDEGKAENALNWYVAKFGKRRRCHIFCREI
jgi:hypothetical protein